MEAGTWGLGRLTGDVASYQEAGWGHSSAVGGYLQPTVHMSNGEWGVKSWVLLLVLHQELYQ